MKLLSYCFLNDFYLCWKWIVIEFYFKKMKCILEKKDVSSPCQKENSVYAAYRSCSAIYLCDCMGI